MFDSFISSVNVSLYYYYINRSKSSVDYVSGQTLGCLPQFLLMNQKTANVLSIEEIKSPRSSKTQQKNYDKQEYY